jgi:hypothetical protein
VLITPKTLVSVKCREFHDQLICERLSIVKLKQLPVAEFNNNNDDDECALCGSKTQYK